MWLLVSTRMGMEQQPILFDLAAEVGLTKQIGGLEAAVFLLDYAIM